MSAAASAASLASYSNNKSPAELVEAATLLLVTAARNGGLPTGAGTYTNLALATASVVSKWPGYRSHEAVTRASARKLVDGNTDDLDRMAVLARHIDAAGTAAIADALRKGVDVRVVDLVVRDIAERTELHDASGAVVKAGLDMMAAVAEHAHPAHWAEFVRGVARVAGAITGDIASLVTTTSAILNYSAGPTQALTRNVDRLVEIMRATGDARGDIFERASTAMRCALCVALGRDYHASERFAKYDFAALVQHMDTVPNALCDEVQKRARARAESDTALVRAYEEVGELRRQSGEMEAIRGDSVTLRAIVQEVASSLAQIERTYTSTGNGDAYDGFVQQLRDAVRALRDTEFMLREGAYRVLQYALEVIKAFAVPLTQAAVVVVTMYQEERDTLKREIGAIRNYVASMRQGGTYVDDLARETRDAGVLLSAVVGRVAPAPAGEAADGAAPLDRKIRAEIDAREKFAEMLHEFVDGDADAQPLALLRKYHALVVARTTLISDPVAALDALEGITGAHARLPESDRPIELGPPTPTQPRRPL